MKQTFMREKIKNGEMKRYNFWIEKEDYKKLEVIVSQKDLLCSQWFRKTIKEYINKNWIEE